MGKDNLNLDKYTGKGSNQIYAMDKVTKADIRHWCEVINEDNTPFYEIDWDEKSAPPAMLMAWAMPPLWSPETKACEEPHEAVIREINDAGYNIPIGLAMEQEFFKPVKVDDHLSYMVKIESISPSEVDTGIGAGYLMDSTYTFFNQSGETVGNIFYKSLIYKQLNPR